MKEFLEFVIRQLVEFPDEAMLSEIPNGKMIVFRLQMRQTDVGRIIGRNGQTIQAIRALLASSAARHGQRQSPVHDARRLVDRPRRRMMLDNNSGARNVSQ